MSEPEKNASEAYRLYREARAKTAECVKARIAGDHGRAAMLETEARALHDRAKELDPTPAPPAASTTQDWRYSDRRLRQRMHKARRYDR